MKNADADAYGIVYGKKGTVAIDYDGDGKADGRPSGEAPLWVVDAKHWWSIVVARFVPWARVFVPWVAGIGRMNYHRFLTSNFTGAILWGVGLTLAGWGAYFIPGVKSVAYVIAGVVIGLSVIAGIRTWLANRNELS